MSCPFLRLNPVLKKTGRILLYLLGGLIGFVVLLVLGLVVALQFSGVQTWATGKATGWLEGKIGTPVRIARVDIDFVKTLALEGIYVQDQSSDTLLYAGRLSVDIGLFALGQKTINLNEVGLENAVVKLRKPKEADRFNFQYIVDAFASSDSTPNPTDTGKGWTIDAERLEVKNVRFLLDDRYGDMHLNAGLALLELDLKTLGLDTKHPVGQNLHIQGLHGALLTPSPKPAVDSTVQVAASPTPSVLNPSGWSLTVEKIGLEDIDLAYTVKGVARARHGVDYQYLHAQELTLAMSGIEVGANDVRASVDHFSLKEANSGLVLTNLAAEAEIHAPAYELRLKELRTPYTSLRSGLTAGIRDLTDTAVLKHIYLRGAFEKDSVAASDVALFVPLLDSLGYGKLSLKLDGSLRVDGTTAQARGLALHLNKDNYLKLDGKAEEFADVAKLRLSELKHEVSLDPRFADDFLPKGSLPPEVYKLGLVRLKGQASGSLGGLVGRLELASRPGVLTLDRYYYKTDPSFSKHEGSAKLSTTDFRPAVVLGPGLGLGPVSLTADLAGGYSTQGAALRKGEVVVQRAIYQGYAYRNARLSATYLANVAKAWLRYSDRNLKTDLQAVADMRGKTPVFTAKGPIYANPRELKLSTDTLQVATRLNAGVRGTDLKTLTAFVDLRETRVEQPQDVKAHLDSLVASYRFDSGHRVFDVRSEAIQLRMAGQFDPATLGDALQSFVIRYIPLTSLKPKRNLPAQNFSLGLHIPENPVALQALMPGLEIPQPVQMDMEFDSRRQILNTNLSLPYLRYQTNSVTGLTLKTRNVGDDWTIDLDGQSIAADSLTIPEPSLNLSVREGDARFRLKIASEEADNRVRLTGRILGIGDISRLTLSDSKLFLKGQEWILDERTRIEAGGSHLVVNNFNLENKEDSSKSLRIQTPPGSHKALHVSLNNLRIEDITRMIPPLGYQLAGLINLDADVVDVFTLAGLKAQLHVDSLDVNGQKAGNLSVDAEQPRKDRVALNAVLSNYGADLKLDGVYNMAEAEKALDFRLTMDHYQPDKLAPLLQDFVTRWEGDLSADIGIKGSITNPTIAGYLAFNGKNLLQPAATQVPYVITDQKILIRDRRVRLDQFTLVDEAGHTLAVDGSVGLEQVTAPYLNLHISADNFHLINTRATNNPAFFGTAYISSDLQVKGPAAGLTVDGRVSTEEGTKLTYNLKTGQPATAGKAEFIRFVDSRHPEKDTIQVKSHESVAVQGLGLAMNIRLKKGTRFKVLIDPQTGDALECEGTANLRFSMRPNGDINLQGTYDLTDGFYAMSLAGIVSRKFQVRSGSTLTWAGDPTNANINLTAAYTTKAARFDLVQDQEEMMTPVEIAEAKRKQPVSVLLKITNTLLQPDIKFDLEVPETQAGGAGVVASRMQQIEANENELNKQAIGLIALNRFVSTGETSGGGGQTTTEQAVDKVNQTVSDLLSSRLSSLGQDYLGGVDINVNLAQQESLTGTSSNFQDKEVGVSVGKSFANDRLHVSIGGIVNTGNTPGTSTTPMLGDVTALYRLDKRGQLNLKFFRTYNQNIYTTAATERIGVSFIHTKNFSQFRRLFMGDRKRAEAVKEQRTEKAKHSHTSGEDVD